MPRRSERGFSLIEAVIAVSVLAVGVAALAQVAVASGRASVSAQRSTIAQFAARERLEQLRALAWTTDAGVVPVSDWSSDLTVTPRASDGGAGLGVSPGSALRENTAGFCDFLDADGRWLAGGVQPPIGTAWIRRWSIATLDGFTDTLILQVVVVPATAAGAALTPARTSNGAWLVSMKTRLSR
ncbi:MAG TPA: prepilin-type N-terminal cleavage/methylation domain-containing protein [Vicinamibacterales bacterium]|nr:prepilin-type N-terminal cleavage/methylation domain-containing protein [Vicinamibacterales bacterium]